MKNNKVIKAWKNPDYRNGLGDDAAVIPEHPAGWSSLDDDALRDVTGGLEDFELAARTYDVMTYGCCTDLKSCEGRTYRILTIGCCQLTY